MIEQSVIVFFVVAQLRVKYPKIDGLGVFAVAIAVGVALQAIINGIDVHHLETLRALFTAGIATAAAACGVGEGIKFHAQKTAEASAVSDAAVVAEGQGIQLIHVPTAYSERPPAALEEEERSEP